MMAARLGINLSEAAEKIEDFESFDAFFTRRLRPGERPVAESADALLSPADGALTHFARLQGGAEDLTVKGRRQLLTEWLGSGELPW